MSKIQDIHTLLEQVSNEAQQIKVRMSNIDFNRRVINDELVEIRASMQRADDKFKEAFLILARLNDGHSGAD